MIKSFFKENNFEYQEEVSLKPYNTYRIDIKAKYLIFPKNKDELLKILKYLKQNNIKYLVLGNGSNIILTMDYYDGVIIKLDHLNNININNDELEVEAGCFLPKLSKQMANSSLSGLEFASGIPGQVGASIAMNAGAYNKDMASIVTSVTVINPHLEEETLLTENLDFKYRSSFLKEHEDYIVIKATLKLTKGSKEAILNLMQDRQKRRLATQPLEYPNSGSVFRNPIDNYAGSLIENCHLKNYHINDAYVSEKHANFIINKGHATGKDIVNLIEYIQKKVKEKYHIEITLKQKIIK